jgi:hypothetical protein
MFIKTGQTSATVEVKLANVGDLAFKVINVRLWTRGEYKETFFISTRN